MEQIALLGCEDGTFLEQFKLIVRDFQCLVITPADYAALRFYAILQRNPSLYFLS